MTDDGSRGWTDAAIVAVVQARMGSTRLPGKVLADIEGLPLLAWTVVGVQAISGVSQVVVATTDEPADDAVATLATEIGVSVHRGSTHDVLGRCRDAVAPFLPDVVVRQTADNPFPDPGVAEGQVRALLEGDLDYVGIDGWPLGIAAEACRFGALDAADREATDPADREHVMPFIYRQPERFRIGRAPRAGQGRHAAASARYTVDTDADLAFARSLAARLGDGPPVNLGELEAIIEDEPELLAINAGVAQKSWQDAQRAEEARWTS
ncbi:MAG TPA: glycosyltransferase family protein [Candidatus Limnocylindrales bacterium]